MFHHISSFTIFFIFYHDMSFIVAEPFRASLEYGTWKEAYGTGGSVVRIRSENSFWPYEFPRLFWGRVPYDIFDVGRLGKLRVTFNIRFSRHLWTSFSFAEVPNLPSMSLQVKEAAFIQDFHDFRLTIRGSDKKMEKFRSSEVLKNIS